MATAQTGGIAVTSECARPERTAAVASKRNWALLRSESSALRALSERGEDEICAFLGEAFSKGSGERPRLRRRDTLRWPNSALCRVYWVGSSRKLRLEFPPNSLGHRAPRLRRRAFTFVRKPRTSGLGGTASPHQWTVSVRCSRHLLDCTWTRARCLCRGWRETTPTWRISYRLLRRLM